MSIFKDVAVRKKLTDYIDHCARGIKLIEHAYDTLERAKEELGEVGRFAMPSDLSSKLPPIDRAKADIYRRCWREAFDATGLRRLMDSQAEDEFDKSLRENPPASTLANVQSTFVDMSSQADMLFQRGVVNVFRRLSTDYARHRDKPFELPPKVIMACTCRIGFMSGMEVNTFAASKINDIDRVFKTLDGQSHIPRSLESAMNGAWREGEPYEDGYYLARAYKNGNVHLTFKRDDLLAKVNDLIADYYGPRAVGDEQKQSRRSFA